MKGFIYVMSNPSFEGDLFKIGKSSKDPDSFRKKELNTTGVPGKFKVEYAAFVSNYDDLELMIHQKLSHFRYTKDREFFKIPLLNALIQIKEVIGANIIVEEIDKELESQINSKNELVEYYEDGTLKSSKTYEYGILNGNHREFHANGNLKMRTNYCRGQENGFRKEFKSNGELKIKGHMFLGKRQGKWIANSQYGEEVRFYDNGQPVLTWKIYTKHGSVISNRYSDPSSDYEQKVFTGENSLHPFLKN